MKKTLRRLKNRIISGLAAGILILSPVMMPVTAYADEISETVQTESDLTEGEETDTPEDSSEALAEDETSSEEGTDNDGTSSEDAGESENDEDSSEESKESSSEEGSEQTSEDNSETSEDEESASEETAEDKEDVNPEDSSEELPDEEDSTEDGTATEDVVVPENGGDNELHTVLSETKDAVELSVLTTLGDSSVEINPVEVEAEEEGLEVITGYEITGKAEGSSDDASVDTEDPKEQADKEETKEDESSQTKHALSRQVTADGANLRDAKPADASEEETSEADAEESDTSDARESGSKEKDSKDTDSETEDSEDMSSEDKSDEEKDSEEADDSTDSEETDTSNNTASNDGNEEEILLVTAEPTEELQLQPKEKIALYSVEDNKIKDVIIEDISEETEPCEIDEDVNGIALVKDTGYRRLNLELFPCEDDYEKTITLEGMMPKEAWARAFEVSERENMIVDLAGEETGESSDEGFRDDFSGENGLADGSTSDQSKVVLSYDISILDGEAEYQPGEERPVAVTIKDERILSVTNPSLWHVKDDGSREEVTDFYIEEGRIRFTATGFSIYEIVELFGPLPKYAMQLSDFTVNDPDNKKVAGDGFYLFYGGAGSEKYFTNALNGNNAFIETSNLKDASLWYFEDVVADSDNNTITCKISTIVNGTKKYIKNSSGNLVALTDNENDATKIELSTAGGNGYYFYKHKTANKWLQHSGSGSGIRFYTDKNNVTNPKIKALFYSSLQLSPVDPYGLDGLEYGLMYKTDGTTGVGLVFEDEREKNAEELITMVVRTETGADLYFVPEDSDITIWTFHSKGDKYTLSAEIMGEKKYLKIQGNSVVLSDSEDDASAFEVTPDGTGRITLSEGSNSVYYDSNSKTFVAGNTSGDTKWLNLTKVSSVDDEDTVSYSANKVGVSDPKVKNQSQVIVYTRVWNDSTKTYEFYAIDHDGSLYPCYERGDEIMWMGKKINTLLWTFTEYYNDDGTPNNYYELQNIYSGKYLAPQISGQVLSDNKIGINLQGRTVGEYFSTILAWDDPYYSYAGIRPDTDAGCIVSSSKSKAEDFYFAMMDEFNPSLTEVETIDNNTCGISMKMFDFKNERSYMAGFLGDNEEKYTPGLLSTDIKDNGYPTTTKVEGGSLADLFNTTASGTLDSREVNHLFIKSTYEESGYFEFDSCQNFASLYDPDTGRLGNDFHVYKELGTWDQSNKTTLKHGQFFPYNTIIPGDYPTINTENLYGALADYRAGYENVGKLEEWDPRKYEKLHLVYNPKDNTRQPNTQNGTVIEASFVQTPSGKDAWGHDIIFEFTGDDDFWLYVDKELVIDLGGVHSALGGSVNFATGVVVVNKVETNLREIFKNNYIARNPQATQAEIDAYLSNYFADGEIIFKDYTTHDMKIFYLERGGGASNLHMRFNLSYVTPGSVFFTKKVTGTEDLDFELVEYPYQIWYKTEDEEQTEKRLGNDDEHVNVSYQNSTQKVDFLSSYTPPGSTETYPDVYFLQPDKIAEIHFPSDTIEYRIIECGINKDVYNHVYVNGTEITGTDISGEEIYARRMSYDSGWMSVSQRPDVTFTNNVDPENLRPLNFQKKIYDDSGNRLTKDNDPTTFSFRLYLTNGIDDQLVLANKVKYCVRAPKDNPDDPSEHEYLCYYDSTTQTFVKSPYVDLSELAIAEGDSEEEKQRKEAEKERLTFYTSINGTISKIPAWYTIVVPNIPVGAKFKIEERYSEIPVGYGRTEYERFEDTYIHEQGDPDNVGRVRANSTPVMNIMNKRGYGIEANKVWSDKDYTKWHEPVYTALYVIKNGEYQLVANQGVRQLKYPQTNVRYFLFDGLVEGTTLADYRICEVKINNPGFDPDRDVDTDGVVTNYGTLERLESGMVTTMDATAIDSDIAKPYNYSVAYEIGEPQKSVPSLEEPNARTDTITNTREGGLAITLYDMFEPTKPLANGTFTLEKYNSVTSDYEPVTTYVSDSDGKVTILYDFERGTNYRLTETVSPTGYRGLPNPVIFSVNASDEITISGNEEKWQKAYTADHTTGDKLTGYIDLYNMPYTIEVYKFDGEKTGTDGGLKEAYFDLYKGLKGVGGYVKDFTPLYSNLKTGTDGYIPNIDTGLDYGTYFLTEKTPPAGYIGLDGDVIFEITSLGRLKLKNVQTCGKYKVNLVEKEENDGKTVKYFLNIPNAKDETSVDLTVKKTVAGAFGNKAKDFEFTFTTHDGDDAEYEYTKKEGDVPVAVNQKIKTGETFILKHGESVVIELPADTEVTIAETNYGSDGYVTTLQVDEAAAETINSKTLTIDDDTTLAFTNTRDGLVPTGVWMPVGSLIILSIITIAGICLTIIRQRRLAGEIE